MQCALRFLGYRPRSASEVCNHLKRRGYSALVVAGILDKLHTLHYIDDEQFARNWAQDKFSNRGYGPKRVEQELKAKAIDEALIQAVLRETFKPGTEAKRGRLLLQKRFRGRELTDPKTARQAVGFLQRRGYSSQVIFDLLKRFVPDD